MMATVYESESGLAPASDSDERAFLSNPRIVENYTLLQETGVFRYIDSLNREIRNYKNLFAGALEIFNRGSIDRILDATVWQISDYFLPSFIAFLWKPLHGTSDLVVRGYKNYKSADMGLKIESISAFEPFFRATPTPVSFAALQAALGSANAVNAFTELDPDLVIPIMGPSRLYGLVLVGRKILEGEYTREEKGYLRLLMAFVSQAIQNHLHYEQTLRDIKTGLYNNSFFMARLDEELARTRRTNTSSSVIMIDVDRFKHFNDTYGHLAGDRVLEELAQVIKQSIRSGGDVAARFGGEEFIILLPDTDRAAVWVVAERLRLAVAAMRVPWDQPLPQVTISLGVFTFTGAMGLHADEILNRADEALYLSKDRGRNRTTVWGMGLLAKIEHLNWTGAASPPLSRHGPAPAPLSESQRPR